MIQPSLIESLPIPLPNGQRVSSFAKHCPVCHVKVEAKHMHGLARRIENRIILAARAECPQCQHPFNVTCVIDDQKQVSRLWIPTWFLLWWLSTLEAPTPTPMVVTPPTPEIEINPDVSTETLGVFDGRVIPAWVDWQGNRYRFDRIDNGGTIKSNELRYAGLIFSRLQDKA